MQNDPESLDLLHLKKEPRFKQLLQPYETIIFSTSILKINSQQKCQQRIFVLTDRAILNITYSGNILKSFIKKFVSVDNKFNLKRRMQLKDIYGITITSNRYSQIFLLHMINDHDYHYQCYHSKIQILGLVCQQYAKTTKKQMPFYFRPQLTIGQFCTFKTSKKSVKPQQKPTFLDEYYFMHHQFQGQTAVLEYSVDKKQVNLNQFIRIDRNKLKPGQQYYVIIQQQNRSINVKNLYRSKNLISPTYSFYSDKKQIMFLPYVSGGNLKDFLKNKLPLKQQQLIFYLSQILLIVNQLHKEGITYGNLTLQNIWVKDNGFLCLNGLERSMEYNTNDQLNYKLQGNPLYNPPQVIKCQGYNSTIDLWKFGICAYYLCKGCFPFEANNIKTLYHRILTTSFNQQEIPQYIQQLLEKDPDKRITINGLLDYQEFSQINWEDMKSEIIKPPFLPNFNKNQRINRIYVLVQDSIKNNK